MDILVAVALLAVMGLLFWLTRTSLLWCASHFSKRTTKVLAYVVLLGTPFVSAYLFSWAQGQYFLPIGSGIFPKDVREAVLCNSLSVIFAALSVIAEPTEFRKRVAERLARIEAERTKEAAEATPDQNRTP
jgi:hypothetical protein